MTFHLQPDRFAIAERVGSSWPNALIRLLPTIAPALAVAVFIIDAFVVIDIAIAVLYVAVVLMSIGFADRRGILAVSAACMGLTILAFVVQHADEPIGYSTARCFVSLLAIAITAFLSVWIQSTTGALRGQARLLDLTHDAIFVRDMNGVITYWNRAAESLYGWAGSHALGKVSHELVQTNFPMPHDEITAQLLRTGYWEGDLVHTRRDGSQLAVSSRWSLQRDRHGNPVAILETNTDIEQRKQAQEKLAKAQAELAHVSRVSILGELTVSIAHEVNQPLAAIITSGEACLRWLGLDTPPLVRVTRAIERMIRDGRRASDVVQRLRALSSKGDLRRTPVNLNEVIEDAIPLVQREISINRASLLVDLAKTLPDVRGDRFLLQLVVINLVMNAIQAMASDASRPRDLTVRTRLESDNQVLVAVKDSGPGFEPAIEAELFNAFFTTKPNGMGMGLSICRSIVEAHDGRIWASRNDRGGATFQFTLPVTTEDSP